MKLGDLRHYGRTRIMVPAKFYEREFLLGGLRSRKLNVCRVCEPYAPAALDCLAAMKLLGPVSLMGRKHLSRLRLCCPGGSRLVAAKRLLSRTSGQPDR